jgi:6-phosphogluconolactonase
MKFRQFGRVVLASTCSLGLALLLNSCGGGHTFAYLYVTGAYSAGQAITPITILGINSNSGAVYPVANTTAPLNYTNPVAEVVSPDNKNLYVLCQGQAGSTPVVIRYGITTNGGNLNGDITPIETYNTSGTFPTSIAVDPSNGYLYVVEEFALNSQTNGDIDVFPINSDGSLGTPTVTALTNNQNAVGVTVGNCAGSDCYIYVASWNQADTAAPNGTITTYQNAGGTLTQLNTYQGVGAQLASITSYNTGGYLYVSDASQNCIFGFNASAGVLSGIPMGGSCGSGPAPGNSYGITTSSGTGTARPTSLLVNAAGQYLFVTNSGANNIATYTITSGVLAPVASGTVNTGTQPQCLAIDPVKGKYLFTADYLSSVGGGGVISAGGTVSGYSLNSSTGALQFLPNGPFIIGTTLPSCVAAAATTGVSSGS